MIMEKEYESNEDVLYDDWIEKLLYTMDDELEDLEKLIEEGSNN